MPRPRSSSSCRARPPARWAPKGSPPSEQRFVRTADLRYFGQAFEVRVPVPDGDVSTTRLADSVATAFHDAHRALYGYDFRGQPGQQVEWVNLRVSGIGPITRPALRELASRRRAVRRARTGHAAGVFRRRAQGYVDAAIYQRESTRAPATWSHGPAVIEEYGSTVPIHPGSPRASTRSATCS